MDGVAGHRGGIGADRFNHRSSGVFELTSNSFTTKTQRSTAITAKAPRAPRRSKTKNFSFFDF
jgi:hypothetical protein